MEHFIRIKETMVTYASARISLHSIYTAVSAQSQTFIFDKTFGFLFVLALLVPGQLADGCAIVLLRIELENDCMKIEM